jgi:FkbM family methyltransferase
MTAGPNIIDNISLRARMTYVAHLYKACMKQHHRPLIPAFRRMVPEDAVVIDCGAHAGQFAKLFAAMAPSGHIYAVEPGSYAFSILRRAVAFNRLGNVTVERLGLSDKPGELELSMPVKKSGSYGFGLSHFGRVTDPRRHLTETATVSTVDDFVARHGIERLDLIKADTEGWEMRLLSGARQTLERLRPALYLELEDDFLKLAGDSLAGAWKMLTEMGYEGHTLTHAGLGPCDHGRAGDIAFLPRQ